MSDNNVWYVNYCHRIQKINDKRVKDLKNKGYEPLYADKEVKPYSLKEMIKHIGMETAADLFGVSLSSIKSWRWGYRRPSIEQAKKIIAATNGKLDYESIYGCPYEIK